MSWSAGTTLANPVINSCFDIWQRGTSGSANSSTSGLGYNADRWQNYQFSGAITVSRQSTGDTTNLPNVQYCGRIQRNSGSSTTGTIYLTNALETVNSIPFTGKTITFSFYARAGANFSATSNILNAAISYSTGVDQSPYSGFTGSVVNNNATLTTIWQRFTYTGTVPTTSQQLAPVFSYAPTNTALANDYFEITGVQIDLGSVALPVRRNGSTLQGELAACERYAYALVPSGNSSSYPKAGTGFASSSSQAYVIVQTPVTMRVTPSTITVSSAGNWVLTNGSASPSISNIAIDGSSNGSVTVLSLSVSGASSGSFYALQGNNTPSAQIILGSEL